MTTELWILVASAGLQWALIMLAALPKLLKNGLAWGMSNRQDGGADQPAWVDRADRASANLQENLTIFAILVLVVHAAGLSNGTSTLGAWVFFGGRIAHALIYVAGIPGLRTGAWGVSIAGMAMIASVLF